MTTPNFCTWEGGTDDEGTHPPRRPSIDDLGGDEKLDDDEAPPNPVEHFTSGGWNQKVKQSHALARVAASAKIEVRFSGGAPVIQRSIGASTLITNSSFTPTDNGTGDTTITWPAGSFPDFTISPNGLTLYSTSAQPVTGHVEEVPNGIRVRTFVNGAATDVGWSICLN